MKNFIFRCFSQSKRIEKVLPNKLIKESVIRQEKLKNNKVYDGMDYRNTNEFKDKSREIFFPKQHPKLINNEDTNIISYKPPTFNLTEFNKIPSSIEEFDAPEFESPQDSKELDIGILGPPNAGKSSLLNRLIGEYISTVSSKYGTTCDSIEGIYTDINDRIQLVFYDTPGAVKISKSIRSKKIMTKAWSVIPDCDKLIFVVDSVKHLDIVTRETIKRLLHHKFKPSLLKLTNKIKSLKNEEISLEEISRLQNEVNKENIDNVDYEPKTLSSILVMNKVDLVTNKRKLKSLQEELEDLGSFDKVFHVSCETGYGIDNLKNYLKNESLRRPWKYHPEVKSTLSDEEKCEEVFRGLIFNRLYQEIPYDSLVTLRQWVPFNNGEIRIKFQVEVRYKDQVPIILGENGRTLKELREELNKELSKMYQKPVSTFITIVQRRRGVSLETLNEHS